MSNTQFIDFLSQFISERSHIQKIASIFSEEIQLKRNDCFIKEGEVAKHLGFVLDGMVRYYYTTDEGDEVTRWVSLKNEFVTVFSSFITQKKSVENIQAIKPARIIYASKEDWQTLFNEEVFVRDFWTAQLEHFLVGMEARVYSLIALSSKSRYQQLFTDFPILAREVPNKYLASMLGIQSRHLSRLRANYK